MPSSSFSNPVWILPSGTPHPAGGSHHASPAQARPPAVPGSTSAFPLLSSTCPAPNQNRVPQHLAQPPLLTPPQHVLAVSGPLHPPTHFTTGSQSSTVSAGMFYGILKGSQNEKAKRYSVAGRTERQTRMLIALLSGSKSLASGAYRRHRGRGGGWRGCLHNFVNVLHATGLDASPW